MPLYQYKCCKCGRKVTTNDEELWIEQTCYDHSVAEKNQTESEADVTLNDGLVSMNDLIDTIRHLQYEAHKEEERGNGPRYAAGKEFAYGRCADLITRIVKAH